MPPAIFDLPLPALEPGTVPAPLPETVPSPGAGLPLPTVYVPAVWAYEHLSRPLAELASLDTAELDRLGGEGWELTGIVSDGHLAHFYFKRMLS